MSSTLAFGAYNPGVGYSKNPRSFSVTPVNNPAHNNIPRPHDGDDWGTGGTTGVNVTAATNGVVVRNQKDETGYGWYSVLEHTREGGTKFRTLYAHMANQSPWAVGDSVLAGQTLGEAGTTGGSTGIHLHFEVIDGENLSFLAIDEVYSLQELIGV